jgi:hypothetical protein
MILLSHCASSLGHCAADHFLLELTYELFVTKITIGLDRLHVLAV